jgi:hypothetical protein
LEVLKNYPALYKWFSSFGRDTPTVNEMKVPGAADLWVFLGFSKTLQ